MTQESIATPPPLNRMRLSDKKLEKLNWRNKALYDLSAKNTKFHDCDFSFSEIDLGYFHQAEFKNCLFVGVKFTECNFKSASFYNCDFSFSGFHRCQIDIKEILPALPAAPNIRQEVIKSLKSNSIEMGDYDSISILTLQEIDADILHYTYALRGTDTYYRSKYSSFTAKIAAGYILISLLIAGAVWGHGEKPWQLLTSCIFTLLVLGLINMWCILPVVSWDKTANSLHIFEYVFRLFLDMSTEPIFSGFLFVDYVIVIMRYIYIGLFISILYKSISRR